MRAYPLSAVIATSLVTLLAGAPAQAQNGSLTRSFVSSEGLDTNACTIAAPCASFAEAYTKVSANGIVAALDPGKYGPLTITGPVTINGNGWAAITGPSSSTAVAINAGPSDSVTLAGLEIDGGGGASNGILLTSAGKLDVVGCVIRNFTHDGIYLEPTSVLKLSILNTIASDNTNDGIDLSPSGNGGIQGVIDHSTTTANGTDGINVWGANSVSPPNTNIGAYITIVNSVSANNGHNGVTANTSQSNGLTTYVMIRDTTASYNGNSGFEADGVANMIFAHSEATWNNSGINITASAYGASFGDNHIGFNQLGGDVAGTLNPAGFH
jgi:hypothetical protein